MTDRPQDSNRSNGSRRGDRPPPRLQRGTGWLSAPFRWYQAKMESRKMRKYMGQRMIYLNDPSRTHSGHKYPSNKIETSKYTWYSFVPVNLFEQFRRAANFWFLLVACLQLIPNISPINPVTSFVPLIFVLSVSGIKELFEDYKRRVRDREINNLPVTVIRNGNESVITWREITVGDTLKIKKGESIPADIVVLASSGEHGTCYVETAAIDGETNLKLREALKISADLGEGVKSTSGTIESQQPIDPLVPLKKQKTDGHTREYTGTVEIGGSGKLSLAGKQFLPRGCVLRNTDWIIAVAVFTGHETRLMLHSSATIQKRSKLERLVDKGVYILMAFTIALCIFCGIMAGLFVTFWGKYMWYLMLRNHFFDSIPIQGLKAFVTHLILYSVIVPISLYVTMEIVKIILAFWIEQDIEMYHEETNTPARARTSNLVEQLGQIEYVFSDKTGTLTSNQMDFLRCTVGGMAFGKVPETVGEEEEGPKSSGGGQFHFDDPALLDSLRSGNQEVRWFLTLLAVCHTVVIENSNGEMIYQASSPDEGALVFAASKLGFTYSRKSYDSIFISVNGVEEEYKILNILEFTNTRKRMSVIVRCPDGKIRLFCKGADSVIMGSCVGNHNQGVTDSTKGHLNEFATQGLRTLCCAYSEISEADYDAWNKEFYEASIAIDKRDEKIANAAEKIEKNLVLLGASGIEDKLQDGVPETIENLLKANIKVWMLTGDKEETAINIGYATNLINNGMNRFLMNEQNCNSSCSRDDVMNTLDGYLQQGKGGGDTALVIDGTALSQVFKDRDLEQKFYELSSECKSVICCRCAATQKAMVVRLVKTKKKAQCLAIGDGQNDVDMIQAAHIGVGISGKEGLQAVNASDYSIAQFRFLQRLLLVHGRWDYKRLCKLFLYCFYKNMAISLMQFWFAIFSGFGGQTIFDSWAIALFNTLFTSAPIVVFAVFDQDVSAKKVMEYPQLYETGQKNHEFSLKLLFGWIILGLFQSINIFFITFFTFYRGTILSDGTVSSLFDAGTTAYTAMIIVVNIVLMFEYNYWVIWSYLSTWGSILVWFLFMIGYQYVNIDQNEMYYQTWNLFRSATWWLTVLCVSVFSLLPYICIKIIKRNLFPENFHIIQEQMYLGIKSNPRKKSLSRRMVDGIYTGFSFSRK